MIKLNIFFPTSSCDLDRHFKSGAIHIQLILLHVLNITWWFPVQFWYPHRFMSLSISAIRIWGFPGGPAPDRHTKRRNTAKRTGLRQWSSANHTGSEAQLHKESQAVWTQEGQAKHVQLRHHARRAHGAKNMQPGKHSYVKQAEHRQVMRLCHMAFVITSAT